MNQNSKKLLNIIILLSITLLPSCSGRNEKTPEIISARTRFDPLSRQLQGCSLPEHIDNGEGIVREAHGAKYYALAYLRTTPRESMRSLLFRCESDGRRTQLAEGDEDHIIIDFDITENNNVIVLRSNRFEQSPINRELSIENVTLGSHPLIFHDPNFYSGHQYLPSGEIPIQVTQGHSVFSAGYPQQQVGRLKVQGENIFLSYFSPGGNRLAALSGNFSNPTFTPTAAALVTPSTLENASYSFSSAAPLTIVNNRIAISSTLGRVQGPSTTSNDYRTAMKWYDFSLTELMHREIIHEHPMIIRSLKGLSSGLVLILGDRGNSQTPRLYVFSNEGISTYFEVNTPSMNRATDFAVCEGAIWVGGESNFQQARTGSVTSPGDAFLWKYDLVTRAASIQFFGRSRRHTITSLSCATDQQGLLIGVIEDAYLTHDGDHDPSQLYSRGYFGIYRPTTP